MISYRIFLAGFVTLLSMKSCGQNKTEVNLNQKKMEKEIIAFQDKMYDKIQTFSEKPLYILQVNKNNCRVLVTCNGIPHWMTFYENVGESNPIYLNNYILKSGQQFVTIQVYPKSGKEYIVAP